MKRTHREKNAVRFRNAKLTVQQQNSRQYTKHKASYLGHSGDAEAIPAGIGGMFSHDRNVAAAVGAVTSTRAPGASTRACSFSSATVSQAEPAGVEVRGQDGGLFLGDVADGLEKGELCLLYTSPSPRDRQKSRMPSSA